MWRGVLRYGQLTGTLRLLVHDELGLSDAVSLHSFVVDGRRVGRRCEGTRAEVLNRAGRRGIGSDDLS